MTIRNSDLIFSIENEKHPRAAFLAASAFFDCSAVDDLASPSRETRDAAAKLLRKTYKMLARTNWNALLDSLKVGSSQTAVEAQLRSSNFIAEGEMGSGNAEVKLYRL